MQCISIHTPNFSFLSECHLAEKIFIYVKALKLLCNAYQFTHQISASSLNYFLKYEGGPKIPDGVAVVRMHQNHLAEKIQHC